MSNAEAVLRATLGLVSTTYKVRLQNPAATFDALDDEQADALRELIGDDEYLELDKAGEYIAQVADALGVEDVFSDDIDAKTVKKLAKEFAKLPWAEAVELADLDEDDAEYAESYYDELLGLLEIVAPTGQGLIVESLG